MWSVLITFIRWICIWHENAMNLIKEGTFSNQIYFCYHWKRYCIFCTIFFHIVYTWRNEFRGVVVDFHVSFLSVPLKGHVVPFAVVDAFFRRLHFDRSTPQIDMCVKVSIHDFKGKKIGLEKSWQMIFHLCAWQAQSLMFANIKGFR